MSFAPGLTAFRKSGKPVYACLTAPGTREYYLATAADKIFASPEDLIDVKGLKVEATYYKGTLDKLGIQVDVEHAGRYKDAGDMFSRTSMTPETRDVLNSVLDVMYGKLVAVIAESRKKTPEEVRALLDQGPFLAADAKAKGLVDELAYEDQALDALKKAAKLDALRKVSAKDYLRAHVGASGKRVPRIAYLVAQGDILRGRAADFLGEDTAISPEPIARQMRMIADDPSIQGVIFRIDSPGGDAVASDEILREARLLSQKKPMVISMSDVAASGGYYIAMTGDPVVAYPGTLTGSIGVVYGKPNLKGLYEKLGVSKEILKRGRFADIDTTSQPLTEEGRKKLQEGIQAIYKGFVTRVSEGRKKSYAEVDTVAQGRVWLGAQAKPVALVDELGGIDEALTALRRKAHIEPGAPIRLVPYPGRRSFFDQLLQRSFQTRIDPQTLLVLKSLGAGTMPWLEGGMLRVLPYRLEIR